jgi:hypothetical protein
MGRRVMIRKSQSALLQIKVLIDEQWADMDITSETSKRDVETNSWQS